jgi:hypothetical protein
MNSDWIRSSRSESNSCHSLSHSTDLTVGCLNPQPEISAHVFAFLVTAIGQRQPIERRPVVHFIVYAL